MGDQVTSSIVRLINRTGKAVGIGYVLPEDCVITCAHMVALALDIPKDTEEKPDAEITIDFPFGDKGANRKCRVSLWRTLDPNSSIPIEGMDDVAVLEVITDHN